MKVYFSDFFDVDPYVIEKYGAFNISLINDFPLFIDPFLLFHSDKKEYQEMHREILHYVAFLRDQSIKIGKMSDGALRSWYCFPEIKQTWLGYSKIGNKGRGPGMDFARALNDNLHGIFSNFDDNKISRDSHIEKLCLIKENTGRDNISDFVTNLIKGYLLKYTQKFAIENIDKSNLKKFRVSHDSFNYKTKTWDPEYFVLPVYDRDFVLLTPKDLLTKDYTWINKHDLIDKFHDIVDIVSNEELRYRLNEYFFNSLPEPEYTKKGKEKAFRKKDIAMAVNEVIRKYPEFLDYYIKYKEDHGEEAKSVSKERVEEVQNLFVDELSEFINQLSKKTKFYEKHGDTLEESYGRVSFLKDIIENKDGYRIFYFKGEPIKRESDIHIMFRLTWFASLSAISREANEGRGPVDFMISKGASDKTLVEFKLASNTKLTQNLANQVEIYKKAHDTENTIKVILFFSEQEEKKVKRILEDIGISNEKYVVLIDARKDNKISASMVR
ncbi:MAG TPA: hypothetical protein ENO17_04020 [Candidatus Atribacteria bacterium]|nr:hypothetical protein [Candidatus Atribacteria bacterium]